MFTTFKLKVNGEYVSDRIRKSVLQMVCDLQTSIASETTLLLHDPEYRITDSATFDIGKDIVLEIGSRAMFRKLFLGNIVSIEPAVSDSLGTTVVIRAYDKSYMLRRNRPSRPPFLNKTDSDIARQIADEAGLSADVDETPIQHEYLQQTLSDWMFLDNRAKANGFLLSLRLDTLNFKKPGAGNYVVHQLKRKRDILKLGLRLSIVGQPSQYVVRGWDVRQKQAVVGTVTPKTSDVIIEGERLGAEMAEDAFGPKRQINFDEQAMSQKEAEILAKSRFADKAKAFISGHGECVGLPDFRAGDKLELVNMGKKFSGQYYLKAVTHVINATGYRTRFSVERNAS